MPRQISADFYLARQFVDALDDVILLDLSLHLTNLILCVNLILCANLISRPSRLKSPVKAAHT